MGDSLTQGYELTIEESWPHILFEKLHIQVINSGISGDTTGGMLARFQPHVIKHNPSHVIIMGGTNDLWINVPECVILSNILAMTRQAKYKGIIPIVAIPPGCIGADDLPEENLFSNLEQLGSLVRSYQQSLRKFVLEDERYYIDFSDCLKKEDYMEDGIHPNKKGHHIMAAIAKTAIDKLIN